MVESIGELRKKCQPAPKAREFLYTKYMRKVSIYFTKFFLILGASANQITFLQILIMVGSLLPLLYYGNWLFLIASFLLLNVSYLFDHVDGEVARYTKSTYYGRMLDVAGHDIFYAVFIFIGIGAYLRMDNPLPLIFGVSATVFMMMFRLHQMRFEFINIEAKVKEKSGKYSKYFYDITLANTFLPILYISAFLDMAEYFVYFYGVYIPLFWLVWFIRKRKFFMKAQSGRSDEKEFWDNMREHI